METLPFSVGFLFLGFFRNENFLRNLVKELARPGSLTSKESSLESFDWLLASLPFPLPPHFFITRIYHYLINENTDGHLLSWSKLFTVTSCSIHCNKLDAEKLLLCFSLSFTASYFISNVWSAQSYLYLDRLFSQSCSNDSLCIVCRWCVIVSKGMKNKQAVSDSALWGRTFGS